jgi:cellulose synthase/poly-beta-1,6-N-acetylglucosamine synthase-like glycosyltransferase
MTLLFWLSIAVVAYVYAGYPSLLRAWALLRAWYCRLQIADCRLNADWRIGNEANPNDPNPNLQSAICNLQCPGVSIVIAARDEGPRLAARIENLLGLDYPADRRQIVVVSDGSTDNTLDVLARYDGVVDAVSVPPGGKALALNAGVAQARFDVIVFADARQVFASDAVKELVAPLNDPAVGAVTGELLLDAESPCRRIADRRGGHTGPLMHAGADPRVGPSGDRRTGIDRRRTVRSTIADGVGLYWKYEKQIRRLESAIDSTLGATGAIYAMRRSLFRPLPPDTVLDDVLTPMRVVLAGFRVVFNERARAFDRAAIDADAEARRKVRTLAGNYQILALEPRLLLPWHNRVWLQYVSHKIGRLVVPYAMLTMFCASVVLAADHLFYALVLGGQVGLFLLAGCGALIEYRGRIADGKFAALPVPAQRVA